MSEIIDSFMYSESWSMRPFIPGARKRGQSPFSRLGDPWRPPQVELELLQPLHLIAQLGRPLEFELRRRVAHRLSELANPASNVLWRPVLLSGLRHARHRGVVGLADRDERLGDGFLDRLRRDA